MNPWDNHPDDDEVLGAVKASAVIFGIILLSLTLLVGGAVALALWIGARL